MTTVRIQHNSLEFSDDRKQHEHDAKLIFTHAERNKVWFVTGTEAGQKDFRRLLANQARMHGYHGNFHEFGDWVAVSNTLMHHHHFGYEGPFIEGTHGLKPSEGAHMPRGIAWAQGVATNADLGAITVGSAHWLTWRSIQETKKTNTPMVKGQGAFGQKFGAGSGIVFSCGDANVNDIRNDIFRGRPFTTIADELKKHPATHGVNSQHGSSIDYISSWDADGRVKAKSYQVFDDQDLRLYGDHFMLLGTYEIEPIGRKK